MTSETDDESVRVLDEGDGVELLVYLVTAARTQVDEAAEYAPMRLLTAAGPLAEMIEPDASARLRPLLRDIVHEHKCRQWLVALRDARVVACICRHRQRQRQAPR